MLDKLYEWAESHEANTKKKKSTKKLDPQPQDQLDKSHQQPSKVQLEIKPVKLDKPLTKAAEKTQPPKHLQAELRHDLKAESKVIQPRIEPRIEARVEARVELAGKKQL